MESQNIYTRMAGAIPPGESRLSLLLNDDRRSFFLSELAPGTRVLTHYHREDSEVFLIIEGHGTLLLRAPADGQVRRVPARRGDLFRIEPGVVHQLINDGADPLRLVLTCRATHLGSDRVVTRPLAAG